MNSCDDLDLGFLPQIKSSFSGLLKGFGKITTCVTLTGVYCRIKEVVSSIHTYSQLGSGGILNAGFVNSSLCVHVFFFLWGETRKLMKLF